jgi:putative addiction module killer protein
VRRWRPKHGRGAIHQKCGANDPSRRAAAGLKTVAFGLLLAMIDVRQTSAFSEWLEELRDSRAKAAIVARIKRLSFGNPGDVRPVSEGVSELRIDCGPGYRLYFVRRGLQLILLLCGGDKSTQAKDIEKAKALARTWIEEEHQER